MVPAVMVAWCVMIVIIAGCSKYCCHHHWSRALPVSLSSFTLLSSVGLKPQLTGGGRAAGECVCGRVAGWIGWVGGRQKPHQPLTQLQEWGHADLCQQRPMARRNGSSRRSGSSCRRSTGRQAPLQTTRVGSQQPRGCLVGVRAGARGAPGPHSPPVYYLL